MSWRHVVHVNSAGPTGAGDRHPLARAQANEVGLKLGKRSARVACAAILSGVEALLNPMPVQDAAKLSPLKQALSARPCSASSGAVSPDKRSSYCFCRMVPTGVTFAPCGLLMI